MAEKTDNPVQSDSQKPDQQNKTATERVDKQTVKKGDFTKGTISPDVKK